MFRSTKSWRVAATAMAAGLALTACGTTDDSPDAGSGDGGSEDCSVKLAFLGPLTGPYANLGENTVNGANLALSQNMPEDCEVTIENFDSQGDPEKATPLATQIANDEDIIGLVGPEFSGETAATGDAFQEAGVVMVSASATNPDLSTNGWSVFHRVLGNDATQAPGAAAYITDTLGSDSVFVIDDASEYGKGLADGVAEALGDAVVDTDTVQTGQTDFSATVTRVTSSDADVLFYGGYYAEAGLLVKQLRAAGWEGTFMSGDGSKDPGFVDAAGKAAAEGAILTCPCAPAPEDFAGSYEEEFGQAPGTYSAEGYDSAKILIDGIAAGNTTREDLESFVNDYDEAGITKQLKFDETGEVSDVVIYAYEVKDGDTDTGEPIE